jgi:large subunit ribosomal protein L21
MAEKEVKKTTKKPEKAAKTAGENTAKNTTTKSDDFAVIATGGKQYVVRNGDLLKVEKLPGDSKRKEGDKLVFDNVLLTDDGKTTTVGTPAVKGAKVEATLVADGRDKKLHVIRFRAKSRHFRKVGHRQPYTLVKITKV